MKIGCVQKYSDPCHIKNDRFRLIECSCTRRISSKSDRVYSKRFTPLDYEEIVNNASIMREIQESSSYKRHFCSMTNCERK